MKSVMLRIAANALKHQVGGIRSAFVIPQINSIQRSFLTTTKVSYNFSSYEQMKKLNELEKKLHAEALAKNFEGCKKIIEEKIAIKKKSSPSTSLLNDYRVLGELQNNLGYQQEALNTYEEALKIAIKLGAKEIQAHCLSDIGAVHQYSYNYQQAVGYYEESIKILKELNTSPNKEYTSSLLNLGECYVQNGDGNSAIKMYTESKEMINKLLEQEDLDEESLFQLNRNKGFVCDGLGSLKLQNGDLSEALEDLSVALGIYGEMYGESDPILVSTLTNLGILYQQLNQDEDALKIFKRALAIHETKPKEVSQQEFLSLMMGCAKAYSNLKMFNEAVDIFDKLEAKTKEIQKNNNSIIPMVKGHKGFLLIQLSEFERAKKEIDEGLQSLKGKQFNIYNAILLTQKAHITLRVDKQYNEAFKMAEESFIYIRNLKQDDPNCGDCLRIMGVASQNLGNKERAVDYLKQAVEILSAHPDRAEEAEAAKVELQQLLGN